MPRETIGIDCIVVVECGPAVATECLRLSVADTAVRLSPLALSR